MNVSHISVSNLPVLHRFGGAIERRIVEIAQRQAKRGHRVRVFSIGDQTEIREKNGVEYNFLKCSTRLPFRHFEFQYKVVNAVKQRPDEVLHFHSQPEGAWISKGVKAKKLLSYDFFEFRGGNRTPLYPLYKRMLRQFDILLPVSQFCLKESSAFWDLPADQTQSPISTASTLSNSSQTRPPPTASAVNSVLISAWSFMSDASAIRKEAMFCLKPSRRLNERTKRHPTRDRRSNRPIRHEGRSGSLGRAHQGGWRDLPWRRGREPAGRDLQPRRRFRHADARQRNVRNGRGRGASLRQASHRQRLRRLAGSCAGKLRRPISRW